MKKKLIAIIAPMLLIGLMLVNTTPVHATAVLTGVSSARVGVVYTVGVDGLDTTKMYAVTAAHSGGNLSEVIGSGKSSDVVKFTFESEDSDNVVPIQIYQIYANLTQSAAAEDTLLVNLDPADQGLSTAFFVGILGGLLVIVIIVRVVRNLINST